MTILHRLMDKVTIGDECWLWTASLNDSGYGQIYYEGRPHRAHRVMYELLVGPIPDGLTLDHLCRVRRCVNPAHLEPVTRGENVRRGIGPQLTIARHRAQTHCKRGHEFTEENTYLSTLRDGTLARSCRACHAERQRRWLRSQSQMAM